MNTKFGRRELLVLLPVASIAIACDKEADVCPAAKSESLTPEQKKLRKAIGYVHSGGPAEKACSACLYYQEGQECGTCEVMPGPVNPTGTCQLFRS